jgi:hypothetical protein
MDDAVWVDTTDGGLLKQLFGHYPTLHQARICAIDIDRGKDLIAAEVEYADETDAGDAPLRVRMRLEWRGVRSLDMSFQGVEVMDIHLDRQDGLIATVLAPCTGAQGLILAERFEAILTEAQALPSDSEALRLRYR